MKKMLCMVLALFMVLISCFTSASAFSDDSIRLYRKNFTYISDINRDGERDIMDATGVQLYLLEHPQKPDHDPDDMM